MSPEQKDLILGLVGYTGAPSISRDEFLRRWPTTDGHQLGLDLLARALAVGDADGVELSLIVGWSFGLSTRHLPLLYAAAQADWHYRHEDVAQALGQIGTEEALPALAALVGSRPPYLDDLDCGVALSRHALHGIEGIGGPPARELIKAALTDEREPVRANAQRMLDRM